MTQFDGLYVQVNLVCLLVLTRLWRTIVSDYHSQYEARLFSHVLASTIVLTLADMGWVLLSKLLFPASIAVNYAVNTLYFLSTAFVGVTWFRFCEYILGIQFTRRKVLFALLHIPFIVLVALTLSSPVTHLVFYIDGANDYHRGALHILQVFCMNVYFLITSIQGLIKQFDKNEIAQKKKYISVSMLILWAFFAHLLQIFLSGYPLLEIGLTMALLSVFIELRNSIISLDPLTQINNRGQLLRYLAQKFKSFNADRADRSLYLLVLDLDDFKKINDRFGHLEGDFALKLVADSLKKVAAGSSIFISRYGGDEFVVVAEKEDDSAAQALADSIQHTVAAAGAESGKEYTIGVSVGFAKKDAANATVADLIKAADERMYQIKLARKGRTSR